MRERGISRELVLQVLKHTVPVRYMHSGTWKLGYYDGARKIFVTVKENTVITVMTHVEERYIQRLRTSTL